MMETIDITNTGVVDSIRNKMDVATVAAKGLLQEGKIGMFSFGDVTFNKIVIKLASKAHAELIISVGNYNDPSLVAISMGMEGGVLAGIPSKLSVKTLCGTSCIYMAKAFHRDGYNYIQIELGSTVSWSGVGSLFLYNSMKTISIDGSLEYNAATDTKLVVGTVS